MKKVPLTPNAYYQFSQKTCKGMLFSTHDDYLHFLFLYCRQVLPLARTFAYCLLPDSFYILLQIRDEAALQRHAERVGAGGGGIAEDCQEYLARSLSTFVVRYHDALGKPFSESQETGYYEHLATESEVAYRLGLLHLYPLYHKALPENGPWPYSSLHALQSSRHTFLERDTVHEWFGGREGFLKESREIYSEMG